MSGTGMYRFHPINTTASARTWRDYRASHGIIIFLFTLIINPCRALCKAPKPRVATIMSVSTLPASNLPFNRADVQSSHDEDKAFWWSVTGQTFATMLQTSKYNELDQLKYLEWFQQWIVGSFGPAPVDGRPYYSSSFTYDGSPLEYSLNWKEKKMNRETIRFTIEPSSLASGTSADRLNQLAAKDLLTDMGKQVPGIDMAKFNMFLEHFSVPNDSVDSILQKFPPQVPKLLVLTAFDLENGDIGMFSTSAPSPLRDSIKSLRRDL